MDIEQGGAYSRAVSEESSLSKLLSTALNRRDTRNLTHFSLALAALMLAEGAYGLLADSLGLVSDALHMAFHTCGLAITVFGMLLSKRPSTFAFSYGYERYEVLAAFSNALMLVFVCLFVLAGALHRFIEPRAFHEGGIPLKLQFGLAGLILNVVGALSLGPGLGSLDHLHKYVHSAGQRGAGGSTSGLGMRSAALHAYADAGSSLAVILSVLASSAGLVSVAMADTLQSVATAAFTLYIAWPLFTATGMVLLSTRPAALGASVDRARRECLTVEGVLEVMEDHCWVQSPGSVIGSVRVRARQEANEAAITTKVADLYSRAGISDLTVQVDKDANPVSTGPLPMEYGHGHSHGQAQAQAQAQEQHGHSHGGKACHGHGHG